MNVKQSDVDKAILEAAMKEFAGNGFHDTAVADIAERAGVGKGTVYRHFGKKHRLFGALIEEATDTLIEMIEEVYEENTDPDLQVKGIYGAHLDLFDQARPLVELIVNEGLDQTGEMKSEVVSHWQTYEELVSRAFERGVKERTFRQANPEKLSRLFLSWIWGMLRSSVIFSEPNPGSRYGDLQINMFMKGLDEQQ